LGHAWDTQGSIGASAFVCNESGKMGVGRRIADIADISVIADIARDRKTKPHH